MTSLRAKLLLAILRLVNARKAFTDGENFLADALEKQKNGPALPGRRLRRKFLIRDKQIAGVRSFIVQPRENASAHRILYLHGGAYAWDLISLHWTIIEDLIALTGASVTVPIYPLTPTTGWEAAHDAVSHVMNSGRSCNGTAWMLVVPVTAVPVMPLPITGSWRCRPQAAGAGAGFDQGGDAGADVA